MIRWLLLFASLILAWSPPGVAREVPSVEEDPLSRISTDSVKTHNINAAKILSDILADPHYWEGAWVKKYSNRSYEEVRFKEVGRGFVPMIAGDGGTDVAHDVVSRVAFSQFSDLPKHISMMRKVVYLGQGYDPTIDAEYTDTYFFLDGTIIYVAFSWRMYRKHDPQTDRTVLWFEKLPTSAVDLDTMAAYQQTIDQTLASINLRSVFNQVAEPTEVFGMFVLDPGKKHDTYVTFVAKMDFGEDTSWLIRWGSQLRFVLRAGLQHAFEGAVAICLDEMKKATSP
ncbi:MAG: hypothetical protein HN348_15360 [Proteobacteria bacterium]|nr:hypothetical protein [Pseudomonadota bacterium]